MSDEDLKKVLQLSLTEDELKTLIHKLFLLETGPPDENGFYYLFLETG